MSEDRESCWHAIQLRLLNHDHAPARAYFLAGHIDDVKLGTTIFFEGLSLDPAPEVAEFGWMFAPAQLFLAMLAGE